MGVTPGFWAGKRVFVTGHTGFKGAWLSLWLSNLHAVVAGYALRPSTDPSLFVAARVGECLESREGDILDFQRMRTALREAAPQIVLHLAAQALVRPSYQDPLATFSTNLMGTVHVLEACRAVPSVRAVVIVTSDKCFVAAASGRCGERSRAGHGGVRHRLPQMRDWQRSCAASFLGIATESNEA